MRSLYSKSLDVGSKSLNGGSKSLNVSSKLLNIDFLRERELFFVWFNDFSCPLLALLLIRVAPVITYL